MSNFNFSSIQIGGRFVRDPELRTTPTGISVTSFTVAVNRRVGSSQVTDFYNCVAWRNTADFICKYFKKGMAAFLVGSLINKNWNDEHGIKHFSFEIVVDSCHFIDNKEPQCGAVNPSTGELVELDPDEPLPFNQS